MSILAIDQSTTSTSGFLLDEDGRTEALYSRTHRQIYPQPGWVEHDPLELLQNVSDCAETARAAGAEMLALSNQGESCLAWDIDTGAPVSPVLVWQDARTEETCQKLAESAAETIAERARLPVDTYFSASKLGWILANIPEAVQLHRSGKLRLGTTDAFFRDRLTGRFETDIATASRTALLNMDSGQWDPVLCELYAVPIDALPAISDCSGELGSIAGLPLRAAIVDQQAALYGHGVSDPGDSKITFGTGAFALSLGTENCPSYGNGALPTIAWREAGKATIYALDGGIHTASAAVNWAKDLGLFETFDELSRFEGHALAKGLAFVPALAGLACPFWDGTAKGTWLGLDLSLSNSEMVQAVLEGIAYRTDQVLATLAQDIPLTEPIRIDGGMTTNPWFCQALANICGRRFQVSENADITAFGAAQMAARSRGLELPETPMGQLFEPDPNFRALPEKFAKACELAQSWGRV